MANKLDRLRAELVSTLANLDRAHDGDTESVSTDVLYCSLMERSFIVKFQIAENVIAAPDCSDKDRAIGKHDSDLASRRAAEWSMRKQSAISSLKSDMLPAIMKMFEEFGLDAGQLADLG